MTHEIFPPTALPPKPPADGAQFYVCQTYCALTGLSDKPRIPTEDPPISASPTKRISTDEPCTEPARYFKLKTFVDQAITAALMVFALPLILIVALAILVCDGHPVFFRQVRVGKNGRLFRIWKFRTMQRNAEQQTGAVWSSVTDPRVTRLGRWLRCSHLDELPQFLNVLTGDMNLVGPRPERPEFVKQLASELPDYVKRSQVRPGITGLAQLHLGCDQSVAGIPRKVACDLHYIRTASFLRDFTLLSSTLPHIARQLYQKWSNDRRRQGSDTRMQSPAPESSIGELAHQPRGPSSRATSRYGALSSHEDRVA